MRRHSQSRKGQHRLPGTPSHVVELEFKHASRKAHNCHSCCNASSARFLTACLTFHTHISFNDLTLVGGGGPFLIAFSQADSLWCQL